ncbi:MAG TPA: hypothetical protein VMY34_03935 [Acidimicrobiales bacterium]|nr:hypothetical protein [Acidimicrobiales bacterium]
MNVADRTDPRTPCDFGRPGCDCEVPCRAMLDDSARRARVADYDIEAHHFDVCEPSVCPYHSDEQGRVVR